MLIAQQVIHQEDLKNNVLMYGFIGDNKQFIDIYKLLIIDNLWENDKIYFDNLPGCADLTLRHPFTCFAKIISNVKKIDKIIEDKNIDTVYISDIDNISYQFIMFHLKNKVKINVFEEGISHYIYYTHKAYERNFQKAQEWLLDNLFFKPVFGFKFANYWYREGNYDNLPIDQRWSIIPNYFKKSYDRQLNIDYSFISEKTISYINKEIKSVNEHSNVIFIITSIVYGHIDKQIYQERYDAYLKTIYKYIVGLPEDATVIVKLHPRENANVISDIKEIGVKSKHQVIFISKELNIPVELYLQRLRPSAITVFCNSSSIYNGFLYPKCKITDLIHSFFEICEKNHYNIEDLKEAHKNIV